MESTSCSKIQQTVVAVYLITKNTLVSFCNANHEFTIVDISKAGRKSDASVSVNNFLG